MKRQNNQRRQYFLLAKITIFLLSIFVLTLVGCRDSNNTKNEKFDPSENARTAAEICVKSEYAGKVAGYVDCLHPKFVEAQGGKDKVSSGLQKTLSFTGGHLSYDSMIFSPPKEVKNQDNIMYAAVPYEVTVKDMDGKPKTSKDYVVGISEDGGKTWKFLTSIAADTEPMKKAFPAINDLAKPPTN